MELVIDLETTICPTDQWKEGQSLIGKGKGDSSPFNSANEIVSIHWGTGLKDGGMLQTCRFKDTFHCTHQALRDTTLLIGHNIKFDLQWLRECGFKYEGKLWDTMLFEYMQAGGQRVKLSLDECCKRYDIVGKTDIVKEYWERGVNTDEIPREIIEEYGNNDVSITYKLYNKQKLILNKGE